VRVETTRPATGTSAPSAARVVAIAASMRRVREARVIALKGYAFEFQEIMPLETARSTEIFNLRGFSARAAEESRPCPSDA
jgi:hypothetical protein